MGTDLYIWISRWEDFQHYKPERDRAPAWVKMYTKQLDDDRYLDLNPTQRGLLADLRLEFSRARAELRLNRRRLTLRLGMTVYQRDIDRLNHAGFIDLISRETLEQRLDLLYRNSSPHARPRARREGEEEEEVETSPLTPQSGEPKSLRANGTNPRAQGTNPRAQGTNQRAQAAARRRESVHAYIRSCIADDWPTSVLATELVERFHIEPHEAQDLIETETRQAPSAKTQTHNPELEAAQ